MKKISAESKIKLLVSTLYENYGFFYYCSLEFVRQTFDLKLNEIYLATISTSYAKISIVLVLKSVLYLLFYIN